jgi:hypothetical protein
MKRAVEKKRQPGKERIPFLLLIEDDESDEK